MHNLTYQERARFAYADGNTELAEALWTNPDNGEEFEIDVDNMSLTDLEQWVDALYAKEVA